MADNELIQQLSTSLLDITKINKERCEALRFGFNQNGATIFLGIGLHFDQRAGHAFPVICGSQWVSREQAIQLLQEAITALNTKILDDTNDKKI